MGGHNLRYASLIEALGETAEKLSAHQNGVALDKAELEGLCAQLQNRLQEAETLTSTLSGMVSTIEQELQENREPKSLDNQVDIDAPVISPKVAAHLSEIDHVIAQHRDTHKLEETNYTDLIYLADERLEGFDRAIQALFRDDNASKVRHQARTDKGPGGIVITMPALF